MKRFKTRSRISAACAAGFVVAALAVVPALPGSAAVPANRVTQIAQNGFGDHTNDYAWSMAWFKGKLYVGTARNEECVERVTEQFYLPDQELLPRLGHDRCDVPRGQVRLGQRGANLAVVPGGRRLDDGVPIAGRRP